MARKDVTVAPETGLERDMLSLLALMVRQSLKEIKPVFKAKIGVVYDLAGLDIPAEKIEASRLPGYLEAAGGVSFATCPRRGSQLLSIQIRCPSCQGRSLVKADLMVHYECGYVAPVEEFAKDSGYTCPGCRS
jgi:DNA-directed RNA polymerase subunit RPC12/RpoP